MLRSMYSGISAMKSNQTKMDVVGNNVANVGTITSKDTHKKVNTIAKQIDKNRLFLKRGFLCSTIYFPLPDL